MSQDGVVPEAALLTVPATPLVAVELEEYLKQVKRQLTRSEVRR